MTIQPLSDERLAEIRAELEEHRLVIYGHETLAALLARLDKAEADRKIAMTAVMEVVDATRAYLPPDGITAKALINLALAATDNPTIYPLVVEFEALPPPPAGA